MLLQNALDPDSADAGTGRFQFGDGEAAMQTLDYRKDKVRFGAPGSYIVFPATFKLALGREECDQEEINPGEGVMSTLVPTP